MPELTSRYLSLVGSTGALSYPDLLHAERTARVAPKPITPPAKFVKPPIDGGAVGVALTSFMAGWGIGQGGIALYAAAHDDTYEDVMCRQPGWWRGVNDFITFGLSATDCTGTVVEPNADAHTGFTPIRVGDFERIYLGTHVDTGSGTTYACWLATGAAPQTLTPLGLRPVVMGEDGVWVYSTGFGVPVDGGPYAGRYCGRPDSSIAREQLWSTGAVPPVRVIRIDTGEVVAEALPLSGDPVRTPRCEITWEDGTTTTGTGTDYQESVGLPLSAAGLGCEQAYVSKPGAGPDLLPSKIDVESEDTESGAITEISSQEVPSFGPDQRKGLTPGNGAGLVLEKVVNKVTDSCNSWTPDCSGWWEQTGHGTQGETDTGTYRCTYGGAVVDLGECSPYRGTFETKTSTPTITDPATGTEVDWSSSPMNSTDPTVGPTPGEVCMSEWGSAANPIEWVLQPVKCAMVWAFVPRTDVMVEAQTAIAEAWEPTIVGQLPGVVAAAVSVPNGGSGCLGPHVVIPIHLGDLDTGYDGYPLSACDAPFDVLATWARVIGSAVLIWLTGLGIIRRSSAIVNAPGLGGGSA
ncbi:hypothetical protein [Microbacterium suwonense]|uniref:hypothetical protein n=1 Tax=Microbacterium suwonense TaxID=683047 RepID=UPI0025731B5D|nr:hypothetical protein [Microbacterium suwonense]